MNLSYGEQVAKKQAKLQETLKEFWQGEIPVTVTDEPVNFRNKVELGFCHQVKWRDDYDKKDPANKTRPLEFCLVYTSPSPRDKERSRMPASA